MWDGMAFVLIRRSVPVERLVKAISPKKWRRATRFTRPSSPARSPPSPRKQVRDVFALPIISAIANGEFDR